MGSREYRREYNRETYYWRKEHQICVKCGREDAEPHKVLCAECAEKKRHTAKRYWIGLSEETREKAIQRTSARKRSLKAQGLCPRCGRKAAKGKTYCIECLLKARHYSRERYDAKRVKTISADGLCCRCNEPTVPGQKLCKKHYDIARRGAEAARKGLTNAKHVWRRDNAMAFRQKNSPPRQTPQRAKQERLTNKV